MNKTKYRVNARMLKVFVEVFEDEDVLDLQILRNHRKGIDALMISSKKKATSLRIGRVKE